MKFFLILSLTIVGIEAKSQQKIIVPPVFDYYRTSKETSRHAIFKYDEKRDDNIFDKNSRSASLSSSELGTIEKIISKRVKNYNKKAYEPIKEPRKYFKQIIAVIDSHGEKEVWVRCLCEVQKGDWKKYIGIISDGGSCIFTLKINLTKGTIINFGVNGLA